MKNKHIQADTHFSSFFTPEDIICQIPQTDKKIAIQTVLEQISKERQLGDISEILDSIMARDALATTVLGDGLAMPHTRLADLKDLVIGIATSSEGIDFGNEGKVKVMIVILTPLAQPTLYLQVLSSISKSISHQGSIEKVSVMKNPDEVWRFFREECVTLPEYICAGDIMSHVPVTLSDKDNLKDAIDLFVRKKVNSIPVVDQDKELIGEVTATELLKVCLPDYILWMDDLSPIINFEPFMHVLKFETSTWLAEIMSREYVALPENAPAVMVAKELTRLGTKQAYILRNKKLVGVVTLRQFISKIFRE